MDNEWNGCAQGQGLIIVFTVRLVLFIALCDLLVPSKAPNIDFICLIIKGYGLTNNGGTLFELTMTHYRPMKLLQFLSQLLELICTQSIEFS